ncbi:MULTISPECIES: 2'-5' RNA ligase family protein [unclassified Agrococcus]|uniref:2'-5' RNA ligase family protein n=1 Tax=unclassified Agrococcus TaxID=2615065 RepID=UPI0036141236
MTDAPITSIELLLDADAEAAVRAEWDALAAAGVSSMAPHASPSNRPHVTLLARRGGVPHPLPLPPDALPVPLVLGAPVLFGEGERRVLARSLVPSSALLALRQAVLDAVGGGDDVEHMAPGTWTPHVTLARRLRLADLERALPLVGGAVACAGVALRRWDAGTRTVTPLEPGA